MGAMDTRFVKDGDKIVFAHRPVVFEQRVSVRDPETESDAVNLRSLHSRIADNSLDIERYKLTKQNIAEKKITLASDQATLFLRVNGAPTLFADDFSVNGREISWGNSWLAKTLLVGDLIEVVYAPTGNFGGRLVGAQINESRELILNLSSGGAINAGHVGLAIDAPPIYAVFWPSSHGPNDGAKDITVKFNQSRGPRNGPIDPKRFTLLGNGTVRINISDDYTVNARSLVRLNNNGDYGHTYLHIGSQTLGLAYGNNTNEAPTWDDRYAWSTGYITAGTIIKMSIYHQYNTTYYWHSGPTYTKLLIHKMR